ncbi:uncharacterized protein LOC123498898 [Portunus trituberculatus]|uniref:uncharacterized protein LOC123498898 n=1 Tax=Portunus trituberculatus TaxID=210409 RepID=UPI001E1CDEE4|nr:uncharacterized protein LOC123498898 [Portunus trituberculatus]
MTPLHLLLCVAAVLPLTTTGDEDSEKDWYTTWPWYTSTPYPNTRTPSTNECDMPFLRVGDRCVLVVPFVTGTWEESRYYCHTQNSELVQTDNINFFYNLLNFLRDEGLEQHSYWLGARDIDVEGEFRWTIGDGLVPMGSPFWAIKYSSSTYDIEPLGTTTSNCIRMDHERHLYLDDEDCDDEYSFMCEKKLWV